MKRSGLGPGARSLERGSTFKPRKPRRAPVSEKPLRDAFWAGHKQAVCVVTGEVGCDAHHVITEQVLRLRARLLGLEEGPVAWDLRGRLWVARPVHAAHHARLPPLTWGVLEQHAPAVFEFADELDLLPWLERMYPKTTNEGSTP